LILVSAPAGFGKTTLLSEWVSERMKDEGGRMKDEERLHPFAALRAGSSSLILHPSKVAWLSLDEGDSDPARFLAYVVAALQTIAPSVGAGVLAALQSPQPPPTEAILTVLLNEITTLSDDFILVLDDYHVIDAKPVDQALTFLVEHLPPQMHLVIATREDPQLPLARYRARSQLTELRAADLRFTPAEAAEFLNQVMGLNLSAEEVAALEARTEGWIAGLQLAAISMQGQKDTAGFIKSFTGGHHFVLDYLVEEVLEQQPESIQTFLLRTSILDRMCGPLCDAVMGISESTNQRISGSTNPTGRLRTQRIAPAVIRTFADSQSLLEYLEHANLFVVPLDGERRWYCYHYLFGELLRQRLRQSLASTTGTGDADRGVAELHLRASAWYEDNGLEIEAFHHAVAANDIERAARLVEGRRAPGTPRMPLQFRGALAPVLHWLASLPATTLDARPALWVMYASVLSMAGQLAAVEPRLLAAERALECIEPDDESRNLIGHIAAIRALLAASQGQVETIIAQSQRALEYLHPDNLAVRTATIWKLGLAYQLRGDRAAAARAFSEAISISQASGNLIINMAAAIGLAHVQETQNQLHLAAETYRRVLELAGDPWHPATSEAHLGLARICYEWNDLPGAEQHGEQSVRLARQYGSAADRSILGEVVLARVRLAQGDAAGATARLAEADQSTRRQNAVQVVAEVAAARMQTLLRLGDLAAAAETAHDFPLSQARVHLAQGDAPAALAVLEPLRRQAEAQRWEDERLKALVLQALAYHANGQKDRATQLLGEALVLAEPAGRIRTFLDEGLPMAELLRRMKDESGRMKEYIHKLLVAFGEQKDAHPLSLRCSQGRLFIPQPLVEPLSQRELEILRLIAQGLSNHQIGERLFLALDTVKGYNRRIYDKLQVERRTEAVARARELGLL
jgi:LuxR family maltose regulon positive regulatory protein